MSKEEREALRRLDHRVLLNVDITDPSGSAVSGLTEDDFILLDSEKPQTLRSFQPVTGDSSTGRAHIVLLIDFVNNSFSDVARQRQSIDTYLRRNKGRLTYPVSLALLSDTGLRRIDSSTDGNLLANDLHSHFPRPGRFSFNGGPSGGNQRFLLSIQALQTLADEERDVPGRAILVWMGQGWPSLTDQGYTAATLEDKRSYFDALVQLSTTLRVAQVTIDNVSTNDPSHVSDGMDQAALHVTRNPEQAEARDLSLARMVQLTGGRSLNQSGDLAAEIGRCVADAATYYRLSFDPGPVNLPNDPRLLTVKINKPSLTPRTYALYYAQP